MPAKPSAGPPTALTTGASSGIGEALARCFAADGHRLVLVNNAGVLEHGAFSSIDAARHQQLLDFNVSGLTALLAAFVPAMVARGRGRVLNVASIAVFQSVLGLVSSPNFARHSL